MALREFPAVIRSISTTTREKRPNEVNGVDYNFVSQEEFRKKIDNCDFAEWAEVHGNFYGTEKIFIETAIRNNCHTLLSIDVQGSENLKKLYGNRVLSIFVVPPSMEELRKRLVSRGSDSSATIERRLQDAYNELTWRKSFAYEITNDDLAKAFEKLRKIIQRECL